jgi:DNA-binding LacI/PurR family transcriptional regulator
MSAMRPGKPRLRDVAERAGVSVGTASNAFNRPELLSDELRRRVDAAARELAYAGPDPAGRRLRTGRAGVFGLVYTQRLTFAFTDQAAPLFLRGVAEGVERVGAGLLIVPFGPARELTTEAVRQAAVDGFVVYSAARDDPRVAAALERGLPVVTVDQPLNPPTPFVGIDDRDAARAAARHVRDLGHERVAIVSFADSIQGLPLDVTAERRAGYREGLGGAWDAEAVHVGMPDSTARGREVAHDLFAAPERPTAVLAMSDALALGVLEAAHELGVEVPGELSIVGFDDGPAAPLSAPPLTTVAQPHEEKGRLAIELLSARRKRARLILPTELVVRASTGPVPRR